MDEPRTNWHASPEELLAITASPGAIPTTDRVLRISGPGAVACVQGILTNDIEKVPLPALVFGAVLTPKGMIITPVWCHRDAEGVALVVPTEGAEPLRQLLTRSFPPRLAKVTEEPADTVVWWLIGDGPPPDAGEHWTPGGPAPFTALWIAPPPSQPGGGYEVRPTWHADALQLLGGWPQLGREIDDKTLPQEVRFDELGGLAYDKGCYVGQETVARLHFRGHANRTLRRVVGQGAGPTTSIVEDADGKPVAHLGSLARVGDHWIALAKVRREVASGDTVRVGAFDATVSELPIPNAEIARW